MSQASDPTSISEAAEIAAGALLMVSIPLYLQDDAERPWLCGTGFIVGKDGRYFLVTADHVLDDAVERGLFYYIGDKRPRTVGGQMIRSGGTARRANDPFDIAVIQLSAGEMPPYRDVEKVAVPFSWLKPRRTPRPGKNYLIIGFPQSQSRVSSRTFEVHVTAYPFRSDSIAENEYTALGLDPEHKIAMKMDLKIGFDLNGKQRILPAPRGMSGAPIFELYDNLNENDPLTFPLVCVGIEHRKKKESFGGNRHRDCRGHD